MYKNSKLKQEEILRLYKEGVLLTEICKRTTSSQKTVKIVLSHFGIDYDQIKQQVYQEKLDQVVTLYNQGKSQLFIERELGLTRKTIRTLLKSKDLVYRSKSEQHFLNYGTELDETVFTDLTTEALYWLGLLYADGHVNKKEFSIELTLDNKDVLHLEKLKVFLKSNRAIRPGHGNCSRIRINSKIIWDRLHELGFKNDKSYTAVPHELFKFSKDFWRGVVDGDGGVYNNKPCQLFLCGTLETVFDFIIFCGSETGVKDKYPSKCKGKSLYQVHYYGEDCRKILNLLYKDATVYLDRKYAVYQQLLNNNNT